LALLKRNEQDFWRRFVTVDETWIHHHTPETKQASKQWVQAGRIRSQEGEGRKIRRQGDGGTIFWDAKGILFIDYLSKGQTITREYYAVLLDLLDESLKRNRPALQKKTVLFHQDNAPVHKGMAAMKKLADLKYTLVEHPPYSPDLAPATFSYSQNSKLTCPGKNFPRILRCSSKQIAFLTPVKHLFFSME
jgi:histone-lysine N-methyltransferase SETMAR